MSLEFTLLKRAFSAFVVAAIFSGLISSPANTVELKQVTTSDSASPSGNYTLRLMDTDKSWLADKTLDKQTYWPKTPANWRSFLAYYSAEEAAVSLERAESEFGVFIKNQTGYLTYTLLDPEGNPVAGKEVSLSYTGRGKAAWMNENFAWEAQNDPPKKAVTNSAGQVTLSYIFLDATVSSDLNPGNPPSPEMRPKSILKKYCYTTCPAEWPISRGYVKGKYPKGMKAKDFFQIDLIPMVADLEDKGIDKDQVWLHVINPTQQKVRPVKAQGTTNPEIYTFSPHDVYRPLNAVGGAVNLDTPGFIGYPFTQMTKFWLACTKQHKKVSYSVPKDCKSVYPKQTSLYWLIPKAAKNKFIAGGYLVKNSQGKAIIVSAAWPVKIK